MKVRILGNSLIVHRKMVQAAILKKVIAHALGNVALNHVVNPSIVVTYLLRISAVGETDCQLLVNMEFCHVLETFLAQIVTTGCLVEVITGNTLQLSLDSCEIGNFGLGI